MPVPYQTSPSGQRCPVDHTAVRTSALPSDATQAGSESNNKCPVDHETLARIGISFEDVMKEPQKYAHLMTGPNGISSSTSGTANGAAVSNGSAASNGNADAEKCPVDHKAIAAMQAQASGLGSNPQDGSEAAPKAVCPFGFGSVDADGNSSNKTSLHCKKCNALFHDAVKTNCDHSFCRACIETSHNCSRCGSEITELSPDTYLQELIGMFITEHTSNSFLKQRKEDATNDDKDKDVEILKAEFFLQIGLQSMRGGNLQAAQERLQKSREGLEGLPEDQRCSPEVCVQLGAVCGSQGDCCLQLGDVRTASLDYEASLGALQAGHSESPEVRQAVTVSLNKLGDLWYRVGNLESARVLYKQALDRRHSIWQESPGDPIAQIDYALSLAKVADIEEVLSLKRDSEQHLFEAKNVASKLAQDPALAGNKRLKPLLAYLNIAQSEVLA